MQEHSQFFKVDMKSWVLGTVRRVEGGSSWNTAWQNTYREIGGSSGDVGRKSAQ